jgi:hypothetical protein
MNADQAHSTRVRAEMLGTGLSEYTVLKSSSRYLHNFIAADEHIEAVISGHAERGNALLVATNRRVLFLDHQPFFTTSDEFAYGSITGVSSTHAGLFATLILHTRLGDYRLIRVNGQSAEHFEAYISTRILAQVATTPPADVLKERTLYQLAALLAPAAQAFLKDHDTGVISTVDRTGNPSGAVVYYVASDTADCVYVLTKRGTQKARNLLSNGNVHLTIFETDPPQSLQLTGTAHVETDPATAARIEGLLSKPRAYQDGVRPIPIMTLDAGEFMVLRISITSSTYNPYRQAAVHKPRARERV